jgi:hypothetical protein
VQRSYRQGRRTIESVDLIKVDLGVKEGLNGGGDIVRVVVLSMAVTTLAMVMMMMTRHDREFGEVEVEVMKGGKKSKCQWYLKLRESLLRVFSASRDVDPVL